MNDLVLAAKAADWYRLKAPVLDSFSSPITRRVYNMALDEFMVWYRLEPRPGFSKATVSAWRRIRRVRRLGVAVFPGGHHPGVSAVRRFDRTTPITLRCFLALASFGLRL